MDHYSASFHAIKDDLELVKEQFTALLKKDEKLIELGLGEPKALNNQLIQYSQKDALPSFYTKQELSEMKWCLKTLESFKEDGFSRYHENGFDYLPTPIITTGRS